MLIKVIKIALTFVLTLTLTGCWNRRELTELTIASAFGFDKVDDSYQVSVQLINAGEIATNRGGNGQTLPVITQQVAGGKTMFESIRQLTTTTPRKVYSSHIRMLVIGEELARDGIAQVLDILSRDHELRTDFYIVIARNATAEDVLKVLTPLEKIPSNKLFSSIEAAKENWGVSVTVDLHELVFDLVSNGKQPVLATIQIIGDTQTGQSQQNLNSVRPAAIQQFEGAAVFRKDALVGWLTPEETKGYNYIRGEIDSTAVSVACPDDGGRLSIEIIRTRHQLKGGVKDGEPFIDAHVKVEGNVGEVACNLDVGDVANIRKLEDDLARHIEHTTHKAINKAKKYKSDIFGFGNAIHRADPKAWSVLQRQWDKHFVDLPVQVHVDVEIRRTGSVVESFLEKLGG